MSVILKPFKVVIPSMPQSASLTPKQDKGLGLVVTTSWLSSDEKEEMRSVAAGAGTWFFLAVLMEEMELGR